MTARPKPVDLLSLVTEKTWHSQVTTLARLYGWRQYHAMAGRTGKGWTTPVTSRGFPDLVLCRPPRVLFVELKSQDGKLSAEQEEWLAMLRACPAVECYVWRPADLDAVGAFGDDRVETVEAVLRPDYAPS